MIKFERYEFLELFDDEMVQDKAQQHATWILHQGEFVFKLVLNGKKKIGHAILEYPLQQEKPIFDVEITNVGKVSTDQKKLSFYKVDKMSWADFPCLEIQINPFISLVHDLDENFCLKR